MPDITAKLKKVIWRSLENDFTIAAFIPEKTGLEFIATGDLFNPAAGITYEMSGKWIEHAKYGKQFKFDGYCVKEPVAADSIAIYLEKHVKGIGPVLADKLIEKYGKHTIQILKKAPERIANENKKISYDLALRISEQLSEGDKRQDVLIQLEGLFSRAKGLPRNLSQNLVALYGLTAYEIVKNTPYILTEINRIGFLSADKIAIECGIKLNDPGRIRAGIIYIIKQIMSDTGDVWLKSNVITESILGLINGIKLADVLNAFIQLVELGILVKDNDFLTFTQFAEDESLIADCITKFLS